MAERTNLIRADVSWLSFDFRSFYQYRDLFYLMVRREFLAKYTQTILGPLWFILQPLLTAGVFVFLFSATLRVPTQGIPSFLFYFCGLLAWNLVSGSLHQISLSLLSNAELCKKVYFPRIFLPLCQLASAYLALTIQTIVFAGFYLGFYLAADASAPSLWYLDSRVLFVPLIFLQLGFLGLGMGVWVAALSSRYRDFHYLVSFAMPLWMYVSPISYPIELVPESWRNIAMLNPMAPPLIALRSALFHTPGISTQSLLISCGLTFLIGVSGILYFNKAQRSFIDTI